MLEDIVEFVKEPYLAIGLGFFLASCLVQNHPVFKPGDSSYNQPSAITKFINPLTMNYG